MTPTRLKTLSLHRNLRAQNDGIIEKSQRFGANAEHRVEADQVWKSWGIMSVSERTVLVTGGAGYVGSRLVPELLVAGYRVRVLDTCWYGVPDADPSDGSSAFLLIRGDMRDEEVLTSALDGVTDVIHLACISNDPSYDLDPELGKSINLDSFLPLVRRARDAGVSRFIYASSSSVYGVKEEERVTEELALEPLTDYSRFKAECEDILFAERTPSFVTTTLRPATVCGPAPRQRMDLTVNLLTNHAYNTGTIRVFGGNQYRPNLHIQDMCRVYLEVLGQDAEKIDGQVFNVGTDNLTVLEIAEKVKLHVNKELEMVVEPSTDNRSYRISSERIFEHLGFRPIHTVDDAIRDLLDWFERGNFPGAMSDSRYFNIARMQEIIPELSKHA